MEVLGTRFVIMFCKLTGAQCMVTLLAVELAYVLDCITTLQPLSTVNMCFMRFHVTFPMCFLMEEIVHLEMYHKPMLMVG